jgi:hypothetical protein
METHRPLTLSIKELSQAVEKAFQRVAAQHHIEFTPELKIYPGLIMGRQLRQDNLTFQPAEQIATEITEQLAPPPAHPGAAVAVSALSPDPMVVGIRRAIIAGYRSGPTWQLSA